MSINNYQNIFTDDRQTSEFRVTVCQTLKAITLGAPTFGGLHNFDKISI